MALDSNYVKDLSRKLRKVLKKDRSLSPERVHRVRTTIRRVEAAADVLLPKPKNKDRALLKGAKLIRKQAGKVRDMDVLTAYATTIRLAKQHQEEFVPLLEYLGSQRYREAKRLRRAIRTKGRTLRNRLKRFSSHLRRSVEYQQKTKGGVVPEAVGTTIQLMSGLRRPSRFTRLNLHSYRLKVKKLRDVLRLSDNTNHSKLADVLGDVTDAIGEWHDWETLVTLAYRVGDKSSQALSKAIARTAQRKYANALALAAHMRREVFRSKNSALSESAIRTTAKMAS